MDQNGILSACSLTHRLGLATMRQVGELQELLVILTVVSGDDFCTNPSWTNGADPDRNRVGQTLRPVPPLKDTVLVPAGGYAVVYFRANNPGYWFLHCHIEVHQLEGMAVVINEAPANHNPPPVGMDRCRGSFTNWDVEMFKEREQLLNPTSNPTSTTPPKQPATEYFVDFIISVAFVGVWRLVCVVANGSNCGNMLLLLQT